MRQWKRCFHKLVFKNIKKKNLDSEINEIDQIDRPEMFFILKQ